MFEFMSMMGNYESRKVDRYDNEAGDVAVSTAYVSDGEKDYETAVMHPAYNDGKWVIVENYETKEDAQVGHNKWVKVMTADKLPDELVDCANEPFAKLSDELRGGKRVSPRKG